ncbi:response regulator transcription factor [Aquabacterium sp.]|uniref:response regulator transcription factor n=1 Tax=Aquabacterium sp. TaxID=1872578 RepID=UPI002E3254D1|nr:response regulator transcription factor [Aquabacterium sp.]HEX5311398.1 response regulator transcription factor [Aquabacterium sp.]
MIRMVIADDHAIVRGGIRQIMATTDDVQVVAEASSTDEALALVRAGNVDVLLLDISLPGLGGLELLKVLHAEMPSLPVLILSMHNEGQIVQRALKAGAQGYVTKDSEPNVLLTGVRKVAEGGKFIDPALVESVVFTSGETDAHPKAVLSEREYQILQMIVSGMPLGDIADNLHLSPKTVSTHKMRMMQKLGVTNNPDLVRCAIRHGMTPL